MELNIKFDEQMMVEVANRVIDEFEYNGKTIREWADTLAHPKINAGCFRAMSDEELAKWFDLHASEPLWCVLPECPDGECVKCILKWLKSPVGKGE